jgi:hypothetical protein
MGLRFRRSFKLAPGIRMNLGSGGVSWSVGPRGAKVNFSRRGVYGTSSAFGLSSRQRLDSGNSTRKAPSAPVTYLHVDASVSPEGLVILTKADGTQVTGETYVKALKQQKAALLDLLERETEERNALQASIGKLHEQVPNPNDESPFVEVPFEEECPAKPLEQPAIQETFIHKLLPFLRTRLDRSNAQRQRENAEALKRWRLVVEEWAKRKSSHEAEQKRIAKLVRDANNRDRNAMESVLEQRLQAIDWPQETNISFEISEDARGVSLDVDLPEIESMPKEVYIVSRREVRLDTKPSSEKAIRELYMNHVHAVGLRIVGEVFAGLKMCEHITLSGYSQRPDRATGQTVDEYLYSAKILRSQWLKFRFDALSEVDPVAAFDRFDTRRTLSKTGIFKPVEPFT